MPSSPGYELETDVSGKENRDWDDFVQWAQEHGALNRRVAFGISDSGFGRGIVATDSVLPNTTISSVPLALALTVDRARDSVQGRTILRAESAEKAEKLAYSLDRFILCVYLIAQRYDKSGFFHPFVRTLPADTNDLPLRWSTDERECLLVGTNLFGAAEKCLSDMRKQFSTWFPDLSNEHPGLFPTEVFNFDNYIWAECIVRSRGFPGRVVKSSYKECLLPWLDMFNHQRGSSMEWITTSEDERINFKTGSNFVPVSAGEEVFNNYGAKGNEEFLFGYGYCLPENPEDEVLLLVSLDRVDPIRRRWIEAAGIESKFYVKKSNLIPDDLLCLARILASSELELRMEEETCRPSDFMGAENEMAALSMLRTMLERKLEILLENIPNSTSKCDPKHATAALLYRTGQERVLREAMERLKRKRLEIVSSQINSFAVSIPDKPINHDQLSLQASERFADLLARSGGECSVEFTREGVFSSRNVPAGDAILRIPAASSLVSVLSDDDHVNERLMTELLQAHSNLMGTLTDWKKCSLMFWTDSALKEVSSNILERISGRREGLSDDEVLTSAVLDAHTIEVEDDKRRYIALSLPRMPAMRNSCCTVWEWRGDDICLVSLQPGGIEKGARIVVTTPRNANCEDLLESHSHSFLDNSPLPSFDMIDMGMAHPEDQSINLFLSTNPRHRGLFNFIEPAKLLAYLATLEDLVRPLIDAISKEQDYDGVLTARQLEIVSRSRRSKLNVVLNMKHICENELGSTLPMISKKRTRSI